uniref:Uncharacterized protein n=1 Tax=Meloidogyne enterolobii TaxID=390850 RepID=A0A6V7UNN3_MELEN|nr:unnamed protein product [Meloidogyne enterolobii]
MFPYFSIEIKQLVRVQRPSMWKSKASARNICRIALMTRSGTSSSRNMS